jgi:hypothetical protein
MEIITKIYQEIDVLFSLDETVYINATKVAKNFKTSKGNPKDVNEWLNSKPTKDYLKALETAKPEIFGYGKLVITRKGGNNHNLMGTWIHKKLIIAFARWLSPDFAVWCDQQIEEILKFQNSQPNQSVKTSQNFDIKSYTQQNKDLIELIKLINSENAITLHYLDKLTQTLNLKSPLELLGIDLNSYYFIPTELGKFLNKSAVVRTKSVSALALKINKILEAKGFQIKINGIWQLTESGKKYAIQLDNNFSTIKWKLESVL